MDKQQEKHWKILIVFSPNNQDSLLIYQHTLKLFQPHPQFLLCTLQGSHLPGTLKISEKDSPNIDYTLSLGQDQSLMNAFSLVSNNKRLNSPIIAISDEPIITCYSYCYIDQVINNLISNVKADKVKCKEVLNFDIISQEKKKIIRTFTGHLQIHREMSQGVVRLNIYVRFQEKDFMLLAPLWGDGIVISTAFGSTGRSMSLNGPIIHQKLESLILLPVCPLSLNFRPIILPPTSQILLQIDESSRASAKIFADSQQVGELKVHERIIIRSSNIKTKMVTGLTSLSSSENWIIRLHEGISWAEHFGSKKPAVRISPEKTLFKTKQKK